MEMIDVHAHLTNEGFDDVAEVVFRAEEKGVKTIVCSAYDLFSSKQAIKLSKEFDNIFSNVGIHPENVDEFDEKSLLEIEKLAKDDKCVAIGEIGLDYHYVSDNKEKQKQALIAQIELANKLNKPVVIHSRDAMGDMIELLKAHKPKCPSLLHCYSGSYESAEILMELGFSFSFGGVVTFSNAKSVVEVVKKLPIDKILLETDCPYMTPVPFRGQRNEPKNVVYIADMISKIKNISIEDVAKITTQNAKGLFKI